MEYCITIKSNDELYSEDGVRLLVFFDESKKDGEAVLGEPINGADCAHTFTLGINPDDDNAMVKAYITAFYAAGQLGFQKVSCEIYPRKRNLFYPENSLAVAITAISQVPYKLTAYLYFNNETLKYLDKKYEVIEIAESYLSLQEYECMRTDYMFYDPNKKPIGEVPDELCDAIKKSKTNKNAMCDMFDIYLKKRNMSVSQIADNLILVFEKSTCYNILNRNYSGNASKRNVTAIAIALQFEYDDYVLLLKSAGYSLSSSIEDMIFEKVFKMHYNINQADLLLFRLGQKPLTKGYVNNPDETVDDLKQ